MRKFWKLVNIMHLFSVFQIFLVHFCHYSLSLRPIMFLIFLLLGWWINVCIVVIIFQSHAAVLSLQISARWIIKSSQSYVYTCSLQLTSVCISSHFELCRNLMSAFGHCFLEDLGCLSCMIHLTLSLKDVRSVRIGAVYYCSLSR